MSVVCWVLSERCSLLITLRRTLKYSIWSLENHFKALYIIKKKCRIWAKSWPCPLKLFTHKTNRNKLNLLASIFFLTKCRRSQIVSMLWWTVRHLIYRERLAYNKKFKRYSTNTYFLNLDERMHVTLLEYFNFVVLCPLQDFFKSVYLECKLYYNINGWVIDRVLSIIFCVKKMKYDL